MTISTFALQVCDVGGSRGKAQGRAGEQNLLRSAQSPQHLPRCVLALQRSRWLRLLFPSRAAPSIPALPGSHGAEGSHLTSSSWPDISLMSHFKNPSQFSDHSHLLLLFFPVVLIPSQDIAGAARGPQVPGRGWRTVTDPTKSHLLAPGFLTPHLQSLSEQRKPWRFPTSKAGLDDLGGLSGPGWIRDSVTGAVAPARGRHSGRLCLRKLPDQTQVASDESLPREGCSTLLK